MRFKASRHVIIVCSFLIVTIMFIANIDSTGKNKYSNIANYDYKRISILNNVDSTMFKQVIKTAQSSNVIIMKISTDYYDNDRINKVYVSEENIDNYLSKLKIKHNINKNYDKQTNNYYATTNIDRNSKAAIIIYDLLENDSYEIHTLNEYIDTGGYIYTDFKIFYNDIKDFNSFSQSTSKFLDGNFKIEEEITYSNNDNILILSMGVIIVSAFFYFILEIYNIYNQSNKIAIMKLLGFNNWNIFKRVIQNELKIYTIVSIFLLLIVQIGIKNISFFK